MLLLLLACGMRELPPHLQVGPVQAPKEIPTPSSLHEAVALSAETCSVATLMGSLIKKRRKRMRKKKHKKMLRRTRHQRRK